MIKTMLHVVAFGTVYRSNQSLRLCSGHFQSLHLSKVHTEQLDAVIAHG